MSKNSTLEKIKQSILAISAVESYIHPFDEMYSFRCLIQTKCGELVVTIHKSDFTEAGEPRKRDNLASIFCCFSDYELAKEYLKQEKGMGNCNGKLNFHCSGGESVQGRWDACLVNFLDKVGRIIVR